MKQACKVVHKTPKRSAESLRTAQTSIYVYKVKSHAGIAGNECADAIANFQASQANNSVADTGIPGAGPGGNPFSHLIWLAKEEDNLCPLKEHNSGTSTAPAPNPEITYLPKLQNALKSHMHIKVSKTQTRICQPQNRKEKKSLRRPQASCIKERSLN
eukprot:560823-Pelagomonas_calceolata.AAC.1